MTLRHMLGGSKNPAPKKKKSFWKKKSFLLLLTIFAILGFVILQGVENVDYNTDNGMFVTTNEIIEEVSLSEFMDIYNSTHEEIEGGFTKIRLRNDRFLLGYKEGEFEQVTSQLQRENITVYQAERPSGITFADLGISLDDIDYGDEREDQSLFMQILVQLLPIIGTAIIFIFLIRMFMPKGGSMPFGMSSMTKSKTATEVKQKFSDVAGMEEVKNELEEVVEYLKKPMKFLKAGAKIPRGVLLYGPPGAGKTLLARAVAGEAGVPFFTTSGSEFMEMLVGLGASKVRELFRKAKASGASIIFIDEIDAIGKKRGAGSTGGHQEQEQTLNQILTEMDGFDKNTNVIVIAATNRVDTLDPALLRPGRFDRKVYVGTPTLEERVKILEVHSTDKTLDEAVDLASIARRTSGFVGADLENILNEAALRAAKDNRIMIIPSDIEYALEKVVMGPEKKNKTINSHEKDIVTYHELGHGVTAHRLPDVDPVEKISIVSRGMALGVTWMMPTEDRYLYSKKKFLNELVTLLGGRAAEELFFGQDEITTGASNDFQRAKKIAFDMVAKYGMDEELGPVMYYDENHSERYMYRQYSERVAEKIDEKVSDILQNAYKRALALLEENKQMIADIAVILRQREFLSRIEFITFLDKPDVLAAFMEKWNEYVAHDHAADERIDYMNELFYETFQDEEHAKKDVVAPTEDKHKRTKKKQ